MPETDYPYVSPESEHVQAVMAEVGTREQERRREIDSLTLLRDRLPEMCEFGRADMVAVEVIEPARLMRRQYVVGVMGGWAIGNYYQNPDKNSRGGGFRNVVVSEFGDLFDPTEIRRHGVTIMQTEMPKFTIYGLLRTHRLLHAPDPELGPGLATVLQKPDLLNTSIEYLLRVPGQQR